MKVQSELFSTFQCKSDLANDEEIFAEKVKEVNSLRDQISHLVSHQREKLSTVLLQRSGHTLLR